MTDQAYQSYKEARWPIHIRRPVQITSNMHELNREDGARVVDPYKWVENMDTEE